MTYLLPPKIIICVICIHRKEYKTRIVDTERYDVVEKPEYAKKRLESEIEQLKNQVENTKYNADRYLTYAGELEKELKEKEKELNNL